MKKSAPPRIKNAIFWTFLHQFSQQGIKFFIGIWLARILSPEDFGLIAMIAVFSAMSEKLVGMGFATSLVQKNDIDESDCSTVFYTNLGLACATYAAIYCAAPMVAQFYGESSLEHLLRVVGVGQLIRAVFTIQVILLTIKLDFKTPLIIGTTAEVISGAIGISMAYAGFHAWSLVGFSISKATIKCILFHFYGDWRPRLVFSFQRLKEHLGVGCKITLISSIEVAFNHFHSIVIGRIFDPSALGFFSRAKSLQTFASHNTISPLSRVFFPSLSRLNKNPKKLLSMFQKSLELTAFMIFPTMTVLALGSEELILSILGKKWIEASPYLQLMCVIGAIIPIRNQCSNALKAIKRLNEIILIQTCCRVLSIVTVFLTYKLGITYMILGEIIVTVILGISFLAATAKALSVSLRILFRQMIPYALAAAVMAASITLAPVGNVELAPVKLACMIAVGFSSYTLVCHLMRSRMQKELIQVVRSRITK